MMPSIDTIAKMIPTFRKDIPLTFALVIVSLVLSLVTEEKLWWYTFIASSIFFALMMIERYAKALLEKKRATEAIASLSPESTALLNKLRERRINEYVRDSVQLRLLIKLNLVEVIDENKCSLLGSTFTISVRDI